MPAPTTPVAGPGTRVSINGFLLGVEEWSWQVTGVEFDYTNSESPQDTNSIAFTNRGVCVKDATLKVRFVYDQDNDPQTTSPPNFQTGATLSTIVVKKSKSTGKGFSIPSMICCSDGVQMRIKDKLMVDVELKPNGSWTYI